MSCVQYRGAVHYEHIHIFRYDFCDQRRDLSWVTFRCSGHNFDLRGSSVARNPQAAQDSLYTKGCRRFGARVDKTDSWDFRRLLRTRCERPRSRAAQQRDEVAPVHSITSSAMASTFGGTVRPSALATFRLITSSNLVDCMTGRSAGFSPLRTR